MKRLLLDVNVALDAILDRRPHAEAAVGLWRAIEERRATGLLPAHGVTTLFHLTARARGSAVAHHAMSDVLSVFEVAPVGRDVLRRALTLGWRDFEDAVCAMAAEEASCDFIVTRDPRGFSGSPVRALHPATALAVLDEDRGPGRVAERARKGYVIRRHAPGRQPHASRREARGRI